MPYEDAEVVGRSELIVVASVKDGSAVVVPHPRAGPDDGRSWETHAVLVVQAVVKGEWKERELPIVIRYGLDLRADDQWPERGNGETPLPLARRQLALYDTGNSGTRIGPLLADVRKPHLWFLRHGGERAVATDRDFGVTDPEDVQPAALRTYFESYLAADPAAAVRAAIAAEPAAAARGVRYLQHLEVQRVLAEPDVPTRVLRLLPYYAGRVNWGAKSEARAGLVAAGAVAGPYLWPLYEQGASWQREDVIRLWGEAGYAGCVEALVELLKQEDGFWDKQALAPGWWNADVGSPLTQARRESYGRVYAAVTTLVKLGDRRAWEALELTRRRWAAGGFENTQIRDACLDGLRRMDGPR
jgi:hypothetical protein